MEKPYLYYSILYLHFFLTIFMIFGPIFITNYNVLKFLGFLLGLSLFLFYIFNGCFITRIEKSLSGTNYTVIDPILEKLNISIDRNSRTNTTIILYTMAMLITLFKLYEHRRNSQLKK